MPIKAPGKEAESWVMTKYANILLDAVREKDDDCKSVKKNTRGDVVVVCWDGVVYRVRLVVRVFD